MAMPSGGPRSRSPGRPPAPRRSAGGQPPAFGPAIGGAVPYLGTALVALLAGAGVAPTLVTGLPFGLILVTIVQGIGVTIGREAEADAWRRRWWMALACTTMLLPALALQAALSRTPFVSFGSGSAGPLIWVSLGALVLLGSMLLWAATVSAEAPGAAALLWLPAALLVPAVLGTPAPTLGERGGLLALAFAFGLAGAALVLADLFGAPALPAIAGGTYGLGLALLAFAGRLPSFDQGQGRIVPALTVLLVLVTAGALVAAPTLAVVARRFADLVAAASSEQRPDGSGQASAPRSKADDGVS